jgi:methylglyoxal synthase
MGAYKLLTTGLTKPKKVHIRIVHVSICMYVCMPWMGDQQVEAVAKGGVVLVVLLE